jgi:hypothetical protein
MLKDQTVRIGAISLHHVFLEDGATYVIGPVPEGHYGHAPLRPGVPLVVTADSAPNGDTVVTLPCRCGLLLLRKTP